MIGCWLAPDAVARHDNQKGSQLSGTDQPVGGFINSQTIPLVVGVGLPMD
jgi:hypothetical protein